MDGLNYEAATNELNLAGHGEESYEDLVESDQAASRTCRCGGHYRGTDGSILLA
jgi:hypothetical protein